MRILNSSWKFRLKKKNRIDDEVNLRLNYSKNNRIRYFSINFSKTHQILNKKYCFIVKIPKSFRLKIFWIHIFDLLWQVTRNLNKICKKLEVEISFPVFFSFSFLSHLMKKDFLSEEKKYRKTILEMLWSQLFKMKSKLFYLNLWLF